jgi:hypothetical protein
MEINDEKLDAYIANVKNSDLATDILSNYEKAIKRIDVLKARYNKINDLKKPKKKHSSSSSGSESEDTNIGDLVKELDEIKEKLDTETTDLGVVLALYTDYKRVISLLELQYSELQNQFNIIDASKSDITISKIDLDQLL